MPVATQPTAIETIRPPGSPRDDQVVKKGTSARSSAPISRIVNLPGSRVGVYTDPSSPDSSPDYRREDFGPDAQVP